MRERMMVAKRPGIPGYSAVCSVSSVDQMHLEFKEKYERRGYIVCEVSRSEMEKGFNEFSAWKKQVAKEVEDNLLAKLKEAQSK